MNVSFSAALAILAGFSLPSHQASLAAYASFARDICQTRESFRLIVEVVNCTANTLLAA